MGNSGRSARAIALVLIVIVLVVGAVLGLDAWTRHEQSATRASLSNGYATQALAAPFVLTAKSWQPQTRPFATSGQWQYTYTTALSEAATLAAAKAQFGRGAYQVDANHPDVISSNSATLYRDLITEDVAVKVQIAAPANPSRPTAVQVLLSPLAGE